MPHPTGDGLLPLPFAAHVFDRASERRRDEAWLSGARSSPASRVLEVGPSATVALSGEGGLAWRAVSRGEEAELILLGVDEGGAALFARPLGEADAGLSSLREAALSLAPLESGLAVAAVALATWHARHRFCPACGGPTAMADAGHLRRCERCQSDHFPRMDPAVIMLVSDGERCVLGRRPGSVEGRWSNLAGFVEPGESPEAAVVREVHEEVGLKVREVFYRGSQPWPFPSSLMLAYEALVEPGPLVRNDEHQEVAWFTREEIKAAVAEGKMTIPAAISAGHFLLDSFINATGVLARRGGAPAR